MYCKASSGGGTASLLSCLPDALLVCTESLRATSNEDAGTSVIALGEKQMLCQVQRRELRGWWPCSSAHLLVAYFILNETEHSQFHSSEPCDRLELKPCSMMVNILFVSLLELAATQEWSGSGRDIRLHLSKELRVCHTCLVSALKAVFWNTDTSWGGRKPTASKLAHGNKQGRYEPATSSTLHQYFAAACLVQQWDHETGAAV